MDNNIRSYKDLDVWKLAVEQCVETYKLTKVFPKEEMYGLVSQIRRASSSIPANIAEGYSRRYDKEKLYFISNALASNAELETHIIIAEKLEYLNKDEKEIILTTNEHLGKSLTNFYRSLQDKTR